MEATNRWMGGVQKRETRCYRGPKLNLSLHFLSHLFTPKAFIECQHPHLSFASGLSIRYEDIKQEV